MKKKHTPSFYPFFTGQLQHESTRIYSMAFAIPFLIMLLAFAINGVYPFGDRQILIRDAGSQYYPFFLNCIENCTEGNPCFIPGGWEWDTISFP